MKERLSFYEDFTGDPEAAKGVWNEVASAIKETGREDILKNPRVLDIGGGRGEFSEYLNNQGINCVSLDIKDLNIDKDAKPLRGDVHQMPFQDATFDIVHARGLFDELVYSQDFSKIAQEIARVLKPHGILSVFGSSDFSVEEMEKLFKHLRKKKMIFSSLWEKK